MTDLIHEAAQLAEWAEYHDMRATGEKISATLRAQAAEIARQRAELADAELRREIAAFYGNHTWLMRTMIEAAGKLPKLDDGPFKDGFEAGIMEAMARADATTGDDGRQLQDLWEQLTMLVMGKAVLLYLSDGETAEQMALAVKLAREIDPRAAGAAAAQPSMDDLLGMATDDEADAIEACAARLKGETA